MNASVKTKFPLTVKLLRCQDEGLTSREGRQWTDMITADRARRRPPSDPRSPASNNTSGCSPRIPRWNAARQRHHMGHS